MAILKYSNIPTQKITTILIDGRISDFHENSLHNIGIQTIKTSKNTSLYDSISYHPDISFHVIDNEYIVYEPSVNINILNAIIDLGYKLIKGSTVLKNKYPYNIAYNVARVGNYAFHNLAYTDPVIKHMLLERNVKLLHVNQGYTKCLTCIVDESSIITSDKSIQKAALKNNIDVLLIPQNQNIQLPGFNEGFIGGSTGLIDKNLLLFFGCFNNLSSSDEIFKFITNKNIFPISLFNNMCIDIGSLIPLNLTKNG